MIYAQIFKTSAGAGKRCAFENAHKRNPRHVFRVVRYLDGRPDPVQFQSRDVDPERYTWRLERSTR